MMPASVLLFLVLLAVASPVAMAGPAATLPMPADAHSLAFRIVPRQEDPFGCAPAVVEGIFRLAGLGTAPPQRARLPTGTVRPAGGGRTSLQEVRQILGAGGVDSAAFRLDPDGLGRALDAYGPMVLQYDRPVPHFSLALARTGSGIAVADPAEGLRVLGPAERDSRWSGVVLALAAPADRSGAFRQRALAAASDAHSRMNLLQVGSPGPISASPALPRMEIGGSLGFDEGSPAFSLNLGGEPLPWLRLDGEARFFLLDRQAFRLAAEFDRALSGSSGVTVRTEGSLPAAARLQVRFWAVDDPVAWGMGTGVAMSEKQGVSAGITGSLLYAINARTALGLHFDAESPMANAGSAGGWPAGSRIGYRARLQRSEARLRWWFESGIEVPWGNASPEPVGVTMGLGMRVDQKLDST